MAWVRLDDQFPDHPKVAGLSNDAFCLHVTAMCYTARQQTDGKLPCGLLKRLAWRCHDPAIAVAELVASGVWDEDGENGWTIHDYLDYNPSKSELEALAETRRQAGRAGAVARWQSDGKPHGKSHSKQHGKNMPPTPSPNSSSSGDPETGKPTFADVLRLFTERFYETFGHQPPFQTGKDDGTLDKLIAAGLTLQQIDRAISESLDGFTPSSANPYPKTWRYCLPAMQRAMEPARPRPLKPTNGTDPTIRRGAPSEFTPEQIAAADARQAAYEQQMAEELARAGMLK